MTGLSGALVVQSTSSADVNMGTGMVVIGLAALVIGETLIGGLHGPPGCWACWRAASSTASSTPPPSGPTLPVTT